MISEELTQQSKPWFIFISAASFAVVLFFSVYYEIQQARYERAISSMEARKDQLIAQNKSSNEADRAKAVSAKDYLKELEKKQVIWSKIIEKVESTIPRRSDTLSPVVTFKSYNGSSEGRLAVNASTIPNAPDPFTDIAFTIRSFVSDPTFKNVFIPTVARSLTPDGQSVMTFSMNFEYEPGNLVSRARVDQPSAAAMEPLKLGSDSGTDTDEVVTRKPTSPVAPTALAPATTVAPAAATPTAPVPATPAAPTSATPVTPEAPVSPANPTPSPTPSR